MAFLRRGYVPADIPEQETIALHLLNGSSTLQWVGQIYHFEEHSLAGCNRLFVTVYCWTGDHVIQDTFEEFAEALTEKVVAHVE